MLTAFLAEQANIGTRLKRTPVIEPQVAAVLDNTRVNVEAVRITHVDGQEVLSLQQPSLGPEVMATASAPDFQGDLSSVIIGDDLLSRSPIYLGVGDDQQIVGELLVFSDTKPMLAIVWASELLATAISLAILVAVVPASTLVFRRLVARPLREVIEAMSEIATDKQSVELPVADTTEMEDVVKALEVFQITNTKRLTLEQQQAATRAETDEERAEQEEQTKAAQQARELAQAKAHQEAEEERQRAEALLMDIEAILVRAKEGDFESRIEMAGNPEGDKVRERVNDLMQTVDTGLSAVNAALKTLTAGRLTSQMRGEYTGTSRTLQLNANPTFTGLDTAISDVADCSISLSADPGELKTAVGEIDLRINESVSDGAEEQSEGAQEISASLQQIDQTKNKNAAMNEAVFAVVSSMTEVADRLIAQVQKFQCSQKDPFEFSQATY